MRIVDTPQFQRLRYIRQLGLVHLVYPGATHTRFEHALGVYHLARRAIARLKDSERAGDQTVWRGCRLIPYAALVHDIGHYPLSHALEELPGQLVPHDHESAGRRFLEATELGAALGELGEGSVGAIHDLLSGRSDLPLGGLVNGGLDMDKMEYLRRDAFYCGVPYGEIDVDRLLAGLVPLPDPRSGRYEVGVREKAAAPLESLLFAKYQMFRNVYWHHAVRAATCLYKRIVEEAIETELLTPAELVGPTDEELLHRIERRARNRGGRREGRLARRWLPALRHRRLPRRALELTAADLEGLGRASPSFSDLGRKRLLEDELAEDLGLEAGEAMIDFPANEAMFQLDFLVERNDGDVQRLGRAGMPGVLDLPRLARSLHATARVLRIFTLERRSIEPDKALDRLVG